MIFEPIRRHLALAVVAAALAMQGGCAGPGGLGVLGAKGGGSGRQIFGAEAWDSAQMELGDRFTGGRGLAKDPQAGFAIFRQLADQGNPAAETVLAGYYIAGVGTDRDPSTGVTWLKKAADANFGPAKSELAFVYMRGQAVPKDYDSALRYAKSAADQGNATGMTALGALYANGYGVPKDEAAAVGWYRKAANKRDAIAMMALGSAYSGGKGLPNDRVLAYAWYSLAFTNAASYFDRFLAAKNRDDMTLLMTADETMAARALAADWKPGADIAEERAKKLGSASNGDVVIYSAAMDQDVPGVTQRPTDITVIERKSTDDIEVRSDGSRTATLYSEIEIKNESAIGHFSQRPYYMNSQLDRLDIVEAYTLKPDGRKLPVDVSAIFEQAVPGPADATLFDDEKQKVIVFPDVEVGDVLVSTVKYVSQPLIPGLFSYSRAFDRTFAQTNLRVRITVPKSMPLITETHDLRFSKRENGDTVVYEWNYANPRPLTEFNIALDPFDRAPRFFASSFKTYAELASAYSAIADSKTSVTPEIQKTADEITAGVSDRRKQAELIYDWVSRRIRYVAIELGRGGVIPHEAKTVLQNRYGDCKDHSVLLISLLKAKGIDADIVLMNYGVSYAVPGPPTLNQFNHAITYLPDFGLFVDSTAGVAPFGVLPFGEYGKSVVVATTSGQSVRRTPSLSADAASTTLRTSARLGPDGRIVGDSESTSTGPFAVWLRGIAASIQSVGPEQAAKMQLKAKGFEGNGRFEFASPFEPGPSYRIAGHFETNVHPEYISGSTFRLPIGLGLGPQPGEDLLGPIDFIDRRGGTEPTPCFGGNEVEEISLELPSGKHVRELPKGVEIDNAVLHYKSEWSVSGQTVKLRREMTSRPNEPVCIGEERQTAAKALDAIRGDYNKGISLIGP